MVAIAAACLLVLAAIIAVAVVPLQKEADTPTVRAQPRAMFAALLRAANEQPPAVGPGEGQFRYTRWVGTDFACYLCTGGASNGARGFLMQVSTTGELWISDSGDGRLRRTAGDTSFPFPDQEHSWVADGSPAVQNAYSQDRTFSFSADGLPYVNPVTLPTDPADLESVLSVRRALSLEDLATFLIWHPALPSGVREGVYKLASQIKGTTVTGETVDGLGRPGIGITGPHPLGVQTLIFDQRTGAYLGDRVTTTSNSPITGASAGVVISWHALQDSAVADGMETAPTR